MKNRYLFRGKRTNNGEWVIGNLVNSPDGRAAISETSGDWKLHECIPTTISQCTGLKDKNGKLIFENDIVSLSHSSGFGFRKEELVKYGKGGFSPFSVAGWECTPRASECEVIGNRFDNPELLEVRG